MKILVLMLAASVQTLHAAEPLPHDVQQFIEQRDSCEHFRGEVPQPDEGERMEEVSRQFDKYCRGTDKKLAILKKKYSKDAAVRKRLAEYELKIESEPAR
jgi:hypothetical protein